MFQRRLIYLFFFFLPNTLFAQQVQIYSPDFGSNYISNWQLNGVSSVINAKILQLTPSSANQCGTTYWINKVCSNSSTFKFSAFFSFKITPSITTPADGFTFIIQQTSNAYPCVGGGMGYEGIPGKSIAIEYDTFKNVEDDNNHIAMDINGSVSHTQNAIFTGHNDLVASNVVLTALGIKLADGQMKYSWIDYDGKYLQVRISNTDTRPATPILNINYDLNSYFDGTSVFYGFGAATGTFYEQHLIYSAFINNDYTPIESNTVVPKQVATSTTNKTICASAFPYTWNGNNYNSVGTFQYHTLSSTGCDSIATLILDTIPTTTSTTTKEICPADSILFNGTTYSQAGTYIVHLTSAAGCDSIATLILKVKSILSSETKISLCQGDTCIFNSKSYFQSGRYETHLTNATGCDSIAILYLTINPTYTTEKTIQEVTDNVNDLITTSYIHTLKTIHGCDSVIITNIQFTLIPNAFTPNGDGKNDFFLKGWHIQVYNRDGVLLYDGSDGWDGRYKGKLVAKDTYLYIVYYQTESTIQSKPGYVMVIRN